MPTEKKQNIINDLKDKFRRAKAVFFVDYKGINASKISALRTEVRENDGEIEIAKNTLVNNAAGENISNKLTGPTAIIFAFSDPIAALKPAYKLFKEIQLPTFKIGILDGRLISDKEMLELATIPSCEILAAKLVGQLKSPIYRLHNALISNQNKLVLTLSAIASQKQ